MKKSKVTYYRLDLTGEKLNKGRFKFVFLSDMHNCMWGENGDELIDIIEREKADIVLCGGDMLVAHPGESVETAADFIKKLSRKKRVYYALGNHEYRLRLYPETYGSMYEEYMSLLRDENIIFLDNEKSEIYVNDIKISLYGLTIERKYYKRFSKLKMPKDYINGFLGEPDKDGINILMAHTPKYMKDYMNWGADISLCGHYHGGVMQLGKNRGLVSPDPSFFPYNAHGKFEEDNKIAIISAGLGEHTIPVRVHNPRELVSVDVYIQ
jgi:predicted MPP superfamily phosphohydrolase